MHSTLKLGGRGLCSFQALSCLVTPSCPRQSPSPAPCHPPCMPVQSGWGMPVLTVAETDPSWTELLSLLQSRLWAGAWAWHVSD